ncbi:MAG TPA: glycosyltransferase family 2 protein [Patescibacteria group bacterium]|nr:glycosyltransferase family 2 protein [Patescibacteria group bacterium]
MSQKKLVRKHQWGAEKNTTPLSFLHAKPSPFKLTLSRVAIVLTVVFWVLYIFSIIIRQLIDGPQSYHFTMEAFSYALVVTFLTFSSLIYLIERHGALKRFAKHERVARSILDKFFSKNKPGITVLVPSYNEEKSVIRKTLLSAVLQEYPKTNVVLLIDNNPNPKNPEDAKRLDDARNLPIEIEKLLSGPYKRVQKSFNEFKRNKTVNKKAIRNLANEYRFAARWLNKMADEEKIEDHVDIFFANEVLRKLAVDLTKIEEALEISMQEDGKLSYDRVFELYERLTWIFEGKLTSFERKLHPTLSQEANKAMNLNSYIGIMGTKFEGKLIPDSEFLLTLDADSVLLPEYCLRLVYFLMQPQNSKVAVTQTPYSSFRGAFSRIERLAGATTDIQHILHQGMTQYGATFWVGANAIIRKNALDDIVEYDNENGNVIKRYIQDRTVIEDTESSIDMTSKGWDLVNYPERLSYSATPPDFGSLVVQRRRWANGGLIIMPKLLAQANKKSKLEVMLRMNYLASIAWATFGLIFLLAYPYDGRLLSPLVLLAALPYFIAQASDLKYCGYKYSDIFRIYGFNLIMLPVNLAGVIKSVEQAVTGKKIPFARTPKVKNRTASGMIYVIVPVLIVAFSVFTIYRNVLISNWGNAAFAAFNALAATWAIVAYIGLFDLLTDTYLGLTNWMYVDAKREEKAEPIKTEPKQEIDWKGVLS